MATVNNSEMLAQLREAAQLMQGRDVTPNALGNQVIPVIEVNPKLLRHANVAGNATRTTTGTTSLRAADAAKEMYITSIYMSIGGTALTATLVSSVYATINGVAVDLLAIAQDATAVAVQRDAQIVFAFPVKIDKGSAISFQCTFSAGGVRAQAGFTGYTVDNILG